LMDQQGHLARRVRMPSIPWAGPEQKVNAEKQVLKGHQESMAEMLHLALVDHQDHLINRNTF
uniref:Chordin n=1 Tax=Gongylonema pulchrum TaxID=637853 RepID=A0A183DKV6_9BILA